MNEKNVFCGGFCPDSEDMAGRHAKTCELLGFSPGNKTRGLEQYPLFAKRIEHTLLKAGSTDAELDCLCRTALEHGFRSVCCFPKDVSRCRASLGGSGVMVVTVINFPLAGNVDEITEFECRRAVDDGADEVDMVADLRALVQGNLGAVRDGIARTVETARTRTVKVILETGLLTQAQIIEGAAAAEAGGAAYVKTCTGFGPRGVSIEDILILKAAVGDRLGIKASGGIKNRDFAARLVEAGAELIGTSLGPACV